MLIVYLLKMRCWGKYTQEGKEDSKPFHQTGLRFLSLVFFKGFTSMAKSRSNDKDKWVKMRLSFCREEAR